MSTEITEQKEVNLPRQTPFELRFLIENSSVGGLIGKGINILTINIE
jgi:hypothetical protein